MNRVSSKSSRKFMWLVLATSILLAANFASAQTPSPSLLVLEKSENMLAIVDPSSLKVVARVPAGADPHEIVTSDDGKLAYISNYGGSDSTLNTISVVDLATHRALSPINLGALCSTHGLDYRGGKLYFTAETNKVVGRYDPARQSVDLVVGTGQDRTHMVMVNETLDRIVTSNVSSGTISIIELISSPMGGFGQPPANPQGGAAPPPQNVARKTWRVTNVPAGRGAEGFDISPDNKEIWAANAQDGTVTIIDIGAKRATDTIPIPIKGANRLKFTPDGKLALISGLAGSEKSNLVILEVSTRKVVKTFDLGGGSAGILVEPEGPRAYVAVSAKDKVAIVDLKKLEVSGYVPTGRQPDGLAWAQMK